MSEPFGGLRRFFRELKRRNVYKVAVTYVAVAFVGLQAVNLLIPATTLPGWADQLFLALLILGFPIALVFAWAFEMTADGMRRTPEVEGEATVGKAYRWIGLGLVVLLAVGVWYATAEEGEEQTALSAASSDSAAPTSSTSRDTAGRPRIAVIPFENIARDTGDAFFARGMHEEVLNQLSKVSGLEVISRTSVMQYAETTKTVREISNELDGLNALLEGTVRRAGGRVRITTQLIEAPDDEHLWSNTYERELSPSAIFNIQAEIAQEIADALETQLGEGERDRIQSAPTGNLAAYDAYLQGRNYFWRFWGSTNFAHRDSAIARLREAVRRDSTFAQAHAWLGLAYTFRSPSFGGESRWLDSAEIAVERTDNGWIYEWSYPAESLYPLELKPGSGFRLQNEAHPDGTVVEPDPVDEPHQNAVQYVIDRLESDRPFEGPTSPSMSRTAQQIMETARTSIEEGGRVPLVE